MAGFKLAVGVAWIVFWIYWLVSASSSKASVRGGWRTRLTGVSVVAVIVIADAFRGGGLAVHSVVLAVIGAVLFASGIAIAVWARLHLGRNWGMPMTQRAEPELVTSGPYRFVRHPIYSGLLTAMLGTVLVNNLLGLIVVAVLTAYF
jgi:protein-S-isoprenylcysteine O-methyltransferase Ste14